MDNHPITIWHSPDADDAFMFYGLTAGAVTIPGYRFEHQLCDIQTLNTRCMRAEPDVSAVSVHTYPYIAHDYAVLRAGASMGGKNYGPKLVARSGTDLKNISNLKIATPGRYTSAALALAIYLRERGVNPELVDMGFEEVQPAVASGAIDAGVIIHEGQLTYAQDDLVCLIDFGEWWWGKTGLPLPLGFNVVKRSLGQDRMEASARALRDTIEYSLQHRAEALEYALSYGRGISKADADTFVGMYVNELTLDFGDEGERSIREFLRLGSDYAITPPLQSLDVIGSRMSGEPAVVANSAFL